MHNSKTRMKIEIFLWGKIKMIKVLIVGLTNQMGGTENYIYNLIRRMDLKSFYFDFLIVDDGGRTPYENEINTLFNDGNNHFFYCPNLKKQYIIGNKWLIDFYNKNRYDLIYMNATTAAKTAYCRYAIGKLKIPLISHSHRSDGRRLNHTLYKRYTCSHSIFKLACSRNAADWMYGRKEQNVTIISNGIDTERFKYSESNRKDVREELGFSKNDIVIGHVGRFSEEKNHRFLLDLCSCLDEKYKFLCIGDGPLKDDIVDLIEKKELKNRFITLSVRKDIHIFYSAMDIFAMPSFNEGLPIVSVEAQCSGLRCIFSNTVSAETNLSGRCLYLPINDLNAWIHEIKLIDYNRYDGAEVIKRAGFDMSNSARLVESLFKNVI